MTIKPVDQQKLQALFADLSGKYAGCVEDYFALMYLMRKFKVSVEEIAHQVAFGGNDYGLDAFHVDRAAKNLYLYQFKWSEDHALFKGSMERLAKDGLPRLFGSQTTQDREQNDVVSHLKAELRECRNLIERVYLHFVFKGDVDAADKSEGLNFRREDLENKAHLIEQYFGRDVALEVDFISDKPGHRGPPPSQSYSIRLTGPGRVALGDRIMRVGFIPLLDLYGIYRGLGQTFFDRNIRGALSDDNVPNRKVREALDRIVLKEVDDPAVFAFRHNGVTLAAERVREDGDQLLLHVPRLLNGAQTVSSLTRFLDLNVDNPLLKRNRARLEAVQVLAKLIEADPSSEFVTQVTISNNQQNPVPPWSLRAMDQRQVDFADKFRDELSLFYSRQEGTFENLTDEEKDELGIEGSKDLRIRPLAQTFLAVQGDIHNMSHLPEVFESQKSYESAFRLSYLAVDARAIVLGYKVGLMLNRVMYRIRELLPDKYSSAVAKAKSLTWALLIQALLNDRRYESYLEDFGRGLSKEPAFGDILKQLAGTRIVPILKQLIALPAFQAKVENGRFDFLRASESFKRAMALADDRFGWSKKSF